jgi:hypothetical protein
MQQIMKSCAYHREGIDPWMHPKSRILSRYQGIRKVGANTLEGNPSGSSPVFRANLCQQFPMAIENPHGRVESMVRAKLHGKRRKNDHHGQHQPRTHHQKRHGPHRPWPSKSSPSYAYPAALPLPKT